MVKLNEGVSGEGNALVDLTNMEDPDAAAMMARLRTMRFELAATRFEEYWEKFRTRGGIVEERVGVGAQEVRSPSVQLRITPLGKVELLSTHDQMLGGPSGQSYLGCIFPADPEYAPAITRDAAKVGDLLRDAGVIGRFALDFVVTRTEGSDLGRLTRLKSICARAGRRIRFSRCSFSPAAVTIRRRPPSPRLTGG